jgi:ABC-2 type transport system permease protein
VKQNRFFSIRRFVAVVAKEFIQMRRDRLTFAMMIGIPLAQLILFGYAINSDPRHLPTAVHSADHSPFARSVISALKNSSYFDFTEALYSRREVKDALRLGRVQFVITIPEQFGRRLLRGEKPVLLIEADATDPSATSNALTAFQEAARRALTRELAGALSDQIPADLPITLRVHAEYNPEAITQYNVVPGLTGVILTLTMVIVTGLAVTREFERGTMENLLATPARPLEVMLGKIIPYILVGYIQAGLILVAAKILFNVPMLGSLVLLFALSLIFIAANLSVGVTFSTVAKNQLQAMQLSVFYFLPSILLSGFMFPFRGMPQWAQYVGEVLPLTHYLRLVRGILLKGNTLPESIPHIWPIALFMTVILALGLLRYRRTLD